MEGLPKKISDRSDYKAFLNADKAAMKIQKPKNFQEWLAQKFWHETPKFLRLLRKTEYYQNCAKNPVEKLYFFYLRNKLHKEQVRLGLLIQPNCFGAGLCIWHSGLDIVSEYAQIGANCEIYPSVIIVGSPIIGNNVTIASHVVISGNIVIADGIRIGANSYVNKSFTTPYVTIAGAPAKIISQKGRKDGKIVEKICLPSHHDAT